MSDVGMLVFAVLLVAYIVVSEWIDNGLRAEMYETMDSVVKRIKHIDDIQEHQAKNLVEIVNILDESGIIKPKEEPK